MQRLSLATLAALGALGCSSSYGDAGGASEPLLVSNATFNRGELPDDGGPALPLASSTTSTATAGGGEKSLSGRASLSAWGVGVKLKDFGTGYWVVPVGLPDLVDPGIDWSLKFRFTRDTPLGDVKLQLAETNGKGKFGKPTEIPFKIKSLRPGGKKVLSLVWHNHADLDLQVQSPDGKLTSAKSPNTVIVPEDHKIPNGGLPGNGVLSRDSNARCNFDGIMQEDVVFAGDPAPGTYQVWVDLFDACGEPATTFDLQLWECPADATTCNSEDLVETDNQVGQMLDINADNGTGAGLFLRKFTF